MLGIDVHAHVESLLLIQHAHELNSAENTCEEGDYMVLIFSPKWSSENNTYEVISVIDRKGQ